MTAPSRSKLLAFHIHLANCLRAQKCERRSNPLRSERYRSAAQSCGPSAEAIHALLRPGRRERKGKRGADRTQYKRISFIKNLYRLSEQGLENILEYQEEDT